MNILVIGGSYFLGKAFVELAAEKHTITVLNRGSRKIMWKQRSVTELHADRHDAARLKALLNEEVQKAQADVTEQEAAEQAMAEPIAAETAKREKVYDVVVDFCAYQEGDIRTMAEVIGDQVGQYIFISTCDVYRRGLGRELDESAEFETRDFGGDAGAYILGKAALEQELVSCAEQYGFAYTSVRPAIIYGPDNYAPRESMFFTWIMQAGQVIYPKDADGFFQMVYVRDVARIVLELCGRKEAQGQAFNLCGDDLMDYARYVLCLEQATQQRIERVELTVAEVEDRQIPLPFALTRAESELYSDAKLRQLGVEYTPVVEGMQETFVWYVENSVQNNTQQGEANVQQGDQSMQQGEPNVQQGKQGAQAEAGREKNREAVDMDVNAILQKVDALFDENKAKEAEQLLLQALEAAEKNGDGAAKLQLLNELIGYYRQTSEREPLLRVIEEALHTAERLGLVGSIPYATTTLNVANGYRAIGEIQRSKEYYHITEEIYKEKMPEDDMRMAGLLNNISLLYQELNDYAMAGKYLKRALVICEQNQAGFETAVTYANLANTCVLAENYGMAAAYAETAIELFEKRNLFDAHYCAALSALGMCRFEFERFEEAEALFSKGMELVENSLGRNRQYDRLKENRDRCREAMLQHAGESGKIAAAQRAGQSDAKEMIQQGMADSNKEDEKMTGLELCRKYYEVYGKPALEKDFAPYLNRIAVGLVGEGSDCFGYDDEVSRDHDWGPGFCIWVTKETYAEIGEKLKEMYAGLPAEFLGYKRTVSPQGEGRLGVQTIAGFYQRLVGAADPESINWQTVEDHGLAAATNGEVFVDGEGVFTAFREKLKAGYPERILYLKVAEDAAKFAQTGEYNYRRMLERGDRLTADRMLSEAMGHAMRLRHHMVNSYPPHDKWLYRSCLELERRDMSDSSMTGACDEGFFCGLLQKIHMCLKEDDRTALSLGMQGMEQLGAYLARELYARNIISDIDSYLDAHTEELLMKASVADDTDEQLVDRIVKLEFEAFDKVKNEGGRAYCQNDWPTFSVMRKSQYLTWNRTMLLQYLYDFDREYRRGHNLITEKYARMMESTTPERFREMAQNFPELTEQQKMIIDQIVAVQMSMMESFAEEHPKVAGNARNLHTYEDSIVDTSYETYLRGEISTYSDKMLQLYGQHVVRCMQNGVNIARETIGNTARLYGYENLEKFEASIPD
ncbi:MAG: DUF4125 family protein [Lachnospiraceae bacterium]|nr:DUF4125 family protein [Lachnospiraceae bacterium]